MAMASAHASTGFFVKSEQASKSDFEAIEVVSVVNSSKSNVHRDRMRLDENTPNDGIVRCVL